MAQINLIKTNRLDAVTTVTNKVGVFIDENGILCGIDENGDVTELGGVTFASDAEVLARTEAAKAISPATIDGGVKRYKALITQEGLNVPTAIILENTLGEVPTFSINGLGEYDINANNLFISNKTFGFVAIGLDGGDDSYPGYCKLTVINTNTIRLICVNAGQHKTSSVLLNTPILIEVYP